MHAVPTVSVLFVRAIVHGLITSGGSGAALFAAMGIGEDELTDVDARVPAFRAVRAWEVVETLTGDSLFGMHLAERAPLGAYGVLDWATRSAHSIEAGLHQAVRYFSVLSDLARLYVEPCEGGLRVGYRMNETVTPPRHAAECCLTTIIARGRMHANTVVRPRVVRFAHARPESWRELEAFFGCAVRWAAPETELELDDAMLQIPLHSAEPSLHEVLERHARELVGRLPAGDHFIDGVRAVIAESLRGGDPSLENAARRLAMSPRTLQRRLREDETTFEALLDPLRRDAALRYLGEPSLAISEIAFLLGYHDASTFYRAFKRWTATTPSAWRKSH